LLGIPDTYSTAFSLGKTPIRLESPHYTYREIALAPAGCLQRVQERSAEP
jgi:hypothetical protein